MSGASRRPGARWRRVARDTAASAAVAAGLFALVETGLRLAAPQTPRTEVLSGESLAVKDPLLGHRYRPHARVRHRTPEFDVEYAINGDGRRDFGPSQPDSLAVRVLVLGDSFTFGDGNHAADVWTSVMERLINSSTPGRGSSRRIRVEIVNAGVEGYDTHSEALYLEELVPKVRPDIVVLGFLANDVYTNTPEGSPPSEADRGRGGFALHTVEWARRNLMRNDRAYMRMFLMTARREYYAVPPSEHVRRQLDITRAWLTRMDAFCAARHIPFVVVSIPQQFAVFAYAREISSARVDLAGVDAEIIDRELSPLARERRSRWIEVLPALTHAYRSTGVDMYYRLDGHLTPAGNRVVAETAAGKIVMLVIDRSRRHPRLPP